MKEDFQCCSKPCPRNPRSPASRVIGPVAFEVIDRIGAVEQVISAVRDRTNAIFAFCNMHTFNLACQSPDLVKALSEATVYNDGLGIDIASFILFGETFPENLNGTDFTPLLLSSFDTPITVYLIGSSLGIAEKAASRLQKQFPSIRVVGCHHGFFSSNESEQIANSVRAAGTDLLLLGMGNPRQELWAHEIAHRTGAVILCVGAFLDFAAGRFPRAPNWVRSLRCEWLYRLAIEPSRLWKRYIGGAVPFLYAVLAERFSRSRRPT